MSNILTDTFSSEVLSILDNVEAITKGKTKYTQSFNASNSGEAIKIADKVLNSYLKDKNYRVNIEDMEISSYDKYSLANGFLSTLINSNKVYSNSVSKAAFTLLTYLDPNNKLLNTFQSTLFNQLKTQGLSENDSNALTVSLFSSLQDINKESVLRLLNLTKSWSQAKLSSYLKTTLTNYLTTTTQINEASIIQQVCTDVVKQRNQDIGNEISALPGILGSLGSQVDVSSSQSVVSNLSPVADTLFFGDTDEVLDKEFIVNGQTQLTDTASKINKQKAFSIAQSINSSLSNDQLNNIADAFVSTAQNRYNTIINSLPDLLNQQQRETAANGTPVFTPAFSNNRNDTPVPTVNLSGNQVVASANLAAMQTGSLINPYTEFAWVLEWIPTIPVGIVKFSMEDLFPNTTSTDVLTFNVQDGLIYNAVNKVFDNNKRALFLPLNSSRLVLLKDFSLSRKTIQNTVVTHGSYYYEIFKEAFPEFTMTIDTVVFGNIPEKVQNFLDSVIYFLSNPVKYSGSLYLYDVFNKQLIINSSTAQDKQTVYRPSKRYKLLLKSYVKTRNSDDNSILRISLNGNLVEW